MSNNNNPAEDKELKAALEERTAQRHAYVDWIYNNATHNSTSPKNDTSYKLPEFKYPEVVESHISKLLHSPPTHALFHSNISGFFRHGDWSATNITGVKNTTGNRGSFPWMKSAQSGTQKVELSIREAVDTEGRSKDNDILYIRGALDFYKTINETSYTLEVEVEGVHFVNNGSLFMHAAPSWKSQDLREIPALLRSPDQRNATAMRILHELDARIDRVKHIIATGKYPEGSEEDYRDRTMNCTFAVYGQLRPLPASTTKEELAEYERQIRFPTGVKYAHLPPPELDAYIYSPECAFSIDVQKTLGLKMEQFWSKSVVYAAFLTAVMIIQTFLLVWQMEQTVTPVSLTKVSFVTIIMQTAMDAYSAVIHLTLGTMTDNKASMALIVPAFFSLLASTFFGLRFYATIRSAQSTANVATRPPPAEPPRTTPTTTTQASTPAAVDDVVPSLSRDARLRLLLICMSGAFFMSSIIIFGWIATMTVILYSYWIPQIWHSTTQGLSRQSLTKTFILGTTICRMFVPLYVWACPDNVLFADTSRWVWILFLYSLGQAFVLILQDLLGPRFFLPKSIANKLFDEVDKWDYHPFLPVEDLESAGSADKTVDCTICFEKIDLGVGEGTGERESLVAKVGRSSIARFNYMVPPCHHIAHTKCLEAWLAIKAECPLCRRPLPLP